MIGVGTRDKENAKKFQAKHSLTYAIWFDPDKSIVPRFVDKAIPWNALIDKDGVVRFSAEGFDADAIVKLIEELLPAAAPPGRP